MACLLEVSAPKPGNVSRFHDFGDARFEDFVRSAAAIGPALGDAPSAGVGATVLRAIQATRGWTRTNTNLGIVLLLAPLACAAGAAGRTLRHRLGRVLAGTTVADAEAVYAAIRLAEPGGLGTAAEQDVRAAPTQTLRDVMALAAERDMIAREYTTEFAVVFEVAVPALCAARERGERWSEAATECYLATLAAVPDTLIARKRGRAAAEAVSTQARAVLAAGEPGSAARQEAIAKLDASLRGADHALNPGTTADLVAAALFVTLLEAEPGARENGA